LGETVEGMMGGIVRCGVDKKLLNSAILMKSLDLSKGRTYAIYNESAETSSGINGRRPEWRGRVAGVANVEWKKSIELSKGEALWKSMEVHDWKYLVVA
jgi:hypothetical protein